MLIIHIKFYYETGKDNVFFCYLELKGKQGLILLTDLLVFLPILVLF